MKIATKADVLEVMESYVTSTALFAAVDRGLFWLIEKKPGLVYRFWRT